MKKNYLLICALLIALVFTSCAKKEASVPASKVVEEEPYRIAFVYIGAPGDLGWTHTHEEGRLALEEYFGDKIETTTIENVPEGPDAARIIRQYAADGYDMIFATSFGYMDPMAEVAEEFPNVKFLHCSGYKQADNMSNYFGRVYQARYLTGIVAGMMTKTNIIGYPGAFGIPEVVRGLNAFTLGVRSVNPKAEVRVVWTNTWYDPVVEREAATGLLDAGADIIAQHQDTVEPQKAAQERGLHSIGYDADMRKFVGDSVLTSAIWNWAPYYIDLVQHAINGTWKSESYWQGLNADIVRVADFSPEVPQEVRDKVATEKQKILSGSWDVFTGPIKDNKGNVRVPEGSKMTDAEMLAMDWLVEGVVGSLQ